MALEKKPCPNFDLQCGYISTCYHIRMERCFEEMRLDDNWKDIVPSVDANWEEKHQWMEELLQKMRSTEEKK